MAQAVNMVEVGANDGWTTAASKINDNFRGLYSAMGAEGSVAARVSADRTREAVAESEARLKREISGLESEIDRLARKLDEALEEGSAPPVGSWLLCDYGPEEQWPGTKWSQAQGGLVVVTASEDGGDAQTPVQKASTGSEAYGALPLPLWHRTR